MYNDEIFISVLVSVTLLYLVLVHSLIHKFVVLKVVLGDSFTVRKVLFALEGERVCSADA